MPLRRWLNEATPLPGAPRARALTVDADAWREAARAVAAAGGRSITLWAAGGGRTLRAAFATGPGVLVLSLPLAAGAETYPGIEDLFPCANRLQRAVADLSGPRSTDTDTRPWLRHAAWPADYHPLVAQGGPAAADGTAVEVYPFVRVEGEGVHEIPVGPVHAGVIEPGHFRFSVVGEKILRLEERLGYAHKGIERRFQSMALLDGHRLAARVSGDSAVAYSWAYCQALEGMAGTEVPPRAVWLRALGLELERMANHLGDLGALGNDAGFAFGLAQFSRLKEQLLRATEHALGQRYLFDFVVPGGVGVDPAPEALRALGACAEDIQREVVRLREIYDEHAGVRDRFNGAGTVLPELAARLGLTGLAGRASGQAFDLRCDLPCEPYTELRPRMVVRGEGDVAARVAVRFDEFVESCRLLGEILAHLPDGPVRVSVETPAEGAFGIGLVEGWRGPVFVALEAGAAGAIGRCHPHDPSWQNWPVLEHAAIGNIVPDFPLINKSFNLAYSGHDL
ncbi:MAG: Ni,Fe-hydrogenase III large subunit [Gammaproteobacteria bacterium]|nr:Ni,Fe-hydrogenase III large subunit [Gammaproteobacteria bacterium]